MARRAGTRGVDGAICAARPNGAPTCAQRPAVGAHASLSSRRIYNTDRPYSTECADPARAHDRAVRLGRRLPRRDRRAARRAAGVDARQRRPSRSRRAPTSTPARSRSASTRSMPGIGWIGKNTCVINPTLGSWIFLGEIICSLALEPDAPALDQCGTCTLCLEACPTQALVAPGRARLEPLHLLPDDRASRRADAARSQTAIGSHVYGCDICQEVCPWNAAAPTLGRSGLAAARGVGSAVARRARPDAGRSPAVGARRQRHGARETRRHAA